MSQFKDDINIINKAKSFKELTIVLIVFILVVLISINSPIFLSKVNIQTTAVGLSTTGIVAIGMTIALISGGFDLSVGSIMGLSAVLTTIFAQQRLPIVLAALLAFLICILVGTITGVFIGKVGLNAFITTLAVQQIARGVVFVLTEGSSLRLPGGMESFQLLGQGKVFGFIPVLVLIFIVLTLIADILVKKSSLLKRVFYVGSNEKAANLSGINTGNVKIWVYIGTAALAAIAGILTVSRFGVATSNTGQGIEMTVISAAVIGGASLSGGKGTVLGSVLGVIMLSIVNNALVLFNVSVHWQSLISGFILIMAILIDKFSHKNKDHI